MRGMRHGYGVRTSAAFGVASHSRGADGRRPSISSLQPGMEEAKAIILSNGTKGGGGGEEARGGFVLKSRSDEAPVRRRSLVERTGMKNLMQVGQLLNFTVGDIFSFTRVKINPPLSLPTNLPKH